MLSKCVDCGGRGYIGGSGGQPAKKSSSYEPLIGDPFTVIASVLGGIGKMLGMK